MILYGLPRLHTHTAAKSYLALIKGIPHLILTSEWIMFYLTRIFLKMLTMLYRFDITIWFVGFSLSRNNIWYMALVLAKVQKCMPFIASLSKDRNIFIYIYINNGHFILPLILGLGLMAKQFEYYCNCLSRQWHQIPWMLMSCAVSSGLINTQI